MADDFFGGKNEKKKSKHNYIMYKSGISMFHENK